MKNTIFLLVMLVPIILSAQTQRWVYRYNGPGNGVDEGLSLVYGSDGNIYTTGYSVGTGSSYDFTVISLTANGNQRWVYRYYGPIYGGANSIIFGADSNIYVAGYSNGHGPYRDLVVVSLTSTGTQRWVYRYNSPPNSYNEAYALVYGADSNIYVAGTTTDNDTEKFTVISLSRSGTQHWVYHYIGPGNMDAGANSIVYGTDGNIYIAGISYGSGTDYDFTVISLNSTGTQRWVYRYNGPGNGYDEANSLVYCVDSNIYIAGRSYDSGTDYDFTVISLSSAGTERWVYRYNGPASSYDEARTLVYGTDSNIYVAGGSIGSGTDFDFTVISLSSVGTERWVYRYNGPGNSGDGAFSIIYGANSSIYIAGTSTGSGTGGDFTVASLSSTGTEYWVYRYNGPANDYDAARSIAYGADGNIYAAGSSMDIGIYNTDITVISLNPASGIEEREIASLPLAMTSGIELYPNPAKNYFTVRLRLDEVRLPLSADRHSLKMYDVSGKIVKEARINEQETRISLEGIKPGIYFVQLNNEPVTKKIIITK